MSYYYSVCAIAREEQLYLEEWVCANAVTGAEHFYIYDNGGSVPVRKTLCKYIDSGLVTVIDYPGTSMQMLSYSDCLNTFGQKSKWIGFFDCDEIMIPRKVDTVPEVLKDYETFGGLNVSWKIFGSSGHLTKPNGLMIENYTKTVAKEHYENTHTKAIVQPGRTLRAGSNPHHFIYRYGHFSVSEDFKPVPNAWTPHCSEKLQLNHYFTKSLEEFKTKIQRPRADAVGLPGRQLSDFEMFNNLCTEEDDCALRFVEKVKEMIAKQ